MKSDTTSPVRLDVRPMLAAGDEPFDLIMRTAASVPVGGSLELTAPFQPVPLLAVMTRRGFRHEIVRGDPGEWVVVFENTGLGAETKVSEAAELGQGAKEVLGRHGLDLCCGGALTIAAAARAHKLEVEDLLSELQATLT